MPTEDEKKIADNTENTGKYGRRATDNPSFKEDIPQTSGNNWRSIFNGLGLAFILTVCVTTGRLLGQMDSNVKNIDKHDQKFELVIKRLEKGDLERLALLKSLEKSNEINQQRNIQQEKSDERFEGMFQDANEKLDDIKDGVFKNQKDIIILQQKVSVKDKLSLYDIAMVDYE